MNPVITDVVQTNGDVQRTIVTTTVLTIPAAQYAAILTNLQTDVTVKQAAISAMQSTATQSQTKVSAAALALS